MHKLDQEKRLQKFNDHRVIESIDGLALQAEQAWNESRQLRLPAAYKKATHIVVCAMGGSHLGTDVLVALYGKQMKVPLTVVSDYTLPAWVTTKMLVIVVSYSGNSEETVECYRQAKQRGIPMVVICAGGQLHRLSKNNQIPSYVFTPHYNPSDQPRIGLGYTLFAQLGIFSQLGLISISAQEIQDAIYQLKFSTDHFGSRSPLARNNAKQLADRLWRKQVILFTAEHLNGNGIIFRNQLNETAKQLADTFVIPESNHHLLEGLKYPKDLATSTVAMIFHSDQFSPSNQLRLRLTATVVDKNKVPTINYYLTAHTPLNQAMEVLSLSCYTTFYLAVLSDEDPVAVPWVKWFKEELGKTKDSKK